MQLLVLNPHKCIGCSTCSLVCSIINLGEYSVERAYVKLLRDDRQGRFFLAFSNQCKLCMQCAKNCPEGAISSVEEGGKDHA